MPQRSGILGSADGDNPALHWTVIFGGRSCWLLLHLLKEAGIPFHKCLPGSPLAARSSNLILFGVAIAIALSAPAQRICLESDLAWTEEIVCICALGRLASLARLGSNQSRIRLGGLH